MHVPVLCYSTVDAVGRQQRGEKWKYVGTSQFAENLTSQKT